MVKKKWYQKTRIFRYLTQAFIFIFILQLVIKDVLTTSKDAVTISPEAYCPLGGLASLYRYITEGKTLSHLHISNIIIFAVILLITLVFRTGFCGWLCPFGTLQDIIRKVGKWFGGLAFIKPINRKYKKQLKKHAKGLSFIDKYARYIKYLVLLWAILGAFYYATLIFRDYDPFVALIKVTELESIGGLVILGIVIILSLFTDRPWCKYTCPLGAAIGIIGKISPLRVTRDEQVCTSCNICTKSCPMNIDVAHVKNVASMDCNQCHECVDYCPTKGALDLKFILPRKAIPSTPVDNTIKD